MDEEEINARVDAAAVLHLQVDEPEQEYSAETSQLLEKAQLKRRNFLKKHRLALEFLRAKSPEALKVKMQMLIDEEAQLGSELTRIDSDWALQPSGHYVTALNDLSEEYEKLGEKLDKETTRCIAEGKKVKGERVKGEQVRLQRKMVEADLECFIASCEQWRKAQGNIFELAPDPAYRTNFDKLMQGLQQCTQILASQKYGDRDQEQLKSDLDTVKRIGADLTTEKDNFPKFVDAIITSIVGDYALTVMHFSAMGKYEVAGQSVDYLRNLWSSAGFSSGRPTANKQLQDITTKLQQFATTANQGEGPQILTEMIDGVYVDLKELRKHTYKTSSKRNKGDPKEYLKNTMADHLQWGRTRLTEIRQKHVPSSLYAQHGQWNDDTARQVLTYWYVYQKVAPRAEASLVTYEEEMKRIISSLPKMKNQAVVDYLIKVESQSEFDMFDTIWTLSYMEQFLSSVFNNVDQMRPIWIKRIDKMLIKTRVCKLWASDDKMVAQTKSRTTEDCFEQWQRVMETMQDSQEKLEKIKADMTAATTIEELNSFSERLHGLLLNVNNAYANFKEIRDLVTKLS